MLLGILLDQKNTSKILAFRHGAQFVPFDHSINITDGVVIINEV